MNKDLNGTRVELISMEDPFTKLVPGDKGTVIFTDDMEHIHVNWDNGEGLSLLPGIDKWKQLKTEDETTIQQ